jgi:hypothetical protein
LKKTNIEKSSLNAGAIRLKDFVVEHQVTGAVPGNGGDPFQKLENFLN